MQRAPVMFMGISIAAPVERGFLPTAVLEEVGEAVFFSMGGLGPMFWLWMGLAMRGVTPLPGERQRPTHD